jgi:hypothetical protein
MYAISSASIAFCGISHASHVQGEEVYWNRVFERKI